MKGIITQTFSTTNQTVPQGLSSHFQSSGDLMIIYRNKSHGKSHDNSPVILNY